MNDANPIGMLIGFAPHWWLVLPWVVLLPAAFVVGWITVASALLGTAAALLCVAKFELPDSLHAIGNAPRGDVRLVTYNTDFSDKLAVRLRNDIGSWDADVIVLQDCKTIVSDSLRALFPGAVTIDRFCVASRWPLLDVSPAFSIASPPDLYLQQGTFAVRARVKTPFGLLPVYGLHLPSPRDALGTVRWPQPRRMWPALTKSLEERSNASAAVSRIVRRSDPHFVVAGDFNLPYGSMILGRDWGDLTNAFTDAGVGFGYTMTAGIFAVRIDHVLVPKALAPLRARVLQGYPSEHQPVVVDLQWRG
jgi:endonuclease/exonuclease/phosphatase (EEP) superfamily protein YafD